MRDNQRSIVSRWGLCLAVVVLAVLMAQSVLLGRKVLRQLDVLSVATTDNLQWNLSQGEVEHLQLQHAVMRAMDGDELEPLRRRFNIYYSRVATYHESALFLELRTNLVGSLVLAQVQNRLENFAPIIDGSDQTLREALPEFAAELTMNGHDMRELALLGTTSHAQAADDKRRVLTQILQRLGWVVLALIAALILTALTIGKLYRRGRLLTAASRAAAARMQAMVTSSLDAILVIDRRGRIMAFNGAAETVFGYTSEEAIGRPMVDLIVPDYLQKTHLDGLARLLATGKPRVSGRGRIQSEAKRKSGEIFPVELSVSLSQSGEDTVFVGFLRDISDRVAAETELTRARDDALAGERAKANLLTVMSHEMRTPLNGVLGSMELLDGTDVTAEQRSYLQAMRVSGDLLLHHVNDVLELSVLEAGADADEYAAFDLNQLMQQLVDSQQSSAQARSNTLSLCCRLDNQPHVLGCARRIQQALLNLIGNALKFTENGAVAVEVERLGGGVMVEFRVCDTGLGIHSADLERIFEEFMTVDASYARHREGAGLGLAITRRVVADMGGEISAESEPAEGSMFRIILPLPLVSDSHQQDPSNPIEKADPKRLLLVEDNDINRLLLERMLQLQGHQVTTAAGGAAAVRAVAQGQFDLILMDISMPGVDGIEALRQMRAQKLADGVDIVALTAHAAAEDHARILNSGFAEVLTKPVNQAELATMIKRRSCNQPEPETHSETSDVHQFVAALGGDRARGFLRSFRMDMTQLQADLAAGVAVTDSQRQEAHRLAGSAAVLGFVALRSCLSEVESANQGAPLPPLALAQAWSEAEAVLEPYITVGA